MKKITIMLAIGLITSLQILFAQTSKEIYKDTKTTITSVHKDAKEVLKVAHEDAAKVAQYIGIKTDKLIDSTSKIGNEIWNILIRQQKVYSYSMLFIWLISIISIIRASQLLKKTHLEKTTKDYIIYFGYGWGLLACLSFLYCSYHTYDIFTGIFNPEFGALIELKRIVDDSLKNINQ